MPALKVRSIWAQIPLIGVLGLPAITAEEDFAARFAVQEIENS